MYANYEKPQLVILQLKIELGTSPEIPRAFYLKGADILVPQKSQSQREAPSYLVEEIGAKLDTSPTYSLRFFCDGTEKIGERWDCWTLWRGR